MDVIVKFHGGEGPGVESDWMNAILEVDGEDCSEGIVRGVGLDGEGDGMQVAERG